MAGQFCFCVHLGGDTYAGVMRRPPIAHPWRVVWSAWPWRASLYLLGYTLGGLVGWVALATVALFPVWAWAWARLERRAAGLVGGDIGARRDRVATGVTWRELIHCLVSAPLALLGLLGGLVLVAGAMSTLFAPVQRFVPFAPPWWFAPGTLAESLLAVLSGLVLAPLVAWMLTAVAVGIDTLSAGILAPRAETLARRVDTLRAATLRAEDDVLLERRRLQQHLHDGVQLHLSVTGARLAVLEYDIETQVSASHRAALLQDVADVRDQLQSAMDAVRHAVTGLAPRRLADEGLCAALRDLAHHLPFEATVTCTVPRPAAQVESDLYLIVSESLTNAVKHSGATHVTVDVHGDGDGIVAVVTDDGIGGVDPEGRGILGMESRAERLGGTLSVENPPRGGTSVVVRLPMANP